MFNQNQFPAAFSAYPSLLKKAGFNWGGLLTNTQKTLGIINQAIPIFNQVRPIWNNAKTMFKVMGELNKSNKTESSDKVISNETKNNQSTSNNQPRFFA